MEESTRVRRPLLLKHRCNSIDSVRKAVQEGFDGVEFDVVFSHNGAYVGHSVEDIVFSLHAFLAAIPKCPLAINVKSYGLAPILKKFSSIFPEGSFIFDVPGPELGEYLDSGLRAFGRVSEYEAQVGDGVLIDSFNSDPLFVKDTVDSFGTTSALISPILRGLGEWPAATYLQVDYLITKRIPDDFPSIPV